MADPLVVAPVVEARRQLSQLLARFREERADAAPVVLGSHRQPEAVLLSYDRYRAMAEELEALRARAERASADARALASVRAEGLEPSPFGHALMDKVIEGSLTYEEAIERLDCHHHHPRTAR